MKLKLPICTMILLMGFCTQSSRNMERSDSQGSNSNRLVDVPPSQSNEIKTKEQLENQYQANLNHIKTADNVLGIVNLKDSSNETNEIRLLVGFGLTYPRCLILRGVQGRRQAFHYGLKVIGGKVKMDSRGNGIIERTALGIPSSGWEELDKFLKEQGIDSPLALALDNKHFTDPDEQTIVLEVKSAGVYSMVFFSPFGESKDAKTALRVCRHLEQEFKVRMDCVNYSSKSR